MPPVTHVMMYLGRLKKNDKPVMFGASNGRTFEGKKQNGVSVFDFRMPRKVKTGRQSKFVGYGPVPGI